MLRAAGVVGITRYSTLADRPTAASFGVGKNIVSNASYTIESVSDGVSYYSQGHSASLSDRPAAATFGKGVWQVGDRLYACDGASFVDVSSGYTLRNVATRCCVPNQTNAGFKQTMSRSRHYLRADQPNIQLVYANWRSDYNLGDVGQGGTLTVKASIELSDGTIIPVTFNGSSTVLIADAENAVSDMIESGIAINEYFYVRTYAVHSSAILYSAHPESQAHGEGMEFGVTVTDKTASGTVAYNGPGLYCPIAIVGYSNKPAIALIGDSRQEGQNDVYTNSKFNDIGQCARSIGPFLPYTNFGIPTDSAFKSKTQSNLRAGVIKSYFTHILSNYGINDVNFYSRTAAQAWADMQTLYAVYSPLPIIQLTLPPVSTSTDSWATTANQTTAASNANRVTLNNTIRANLVTSSVIEVADILESARDSGLWREAIGGAAMTADGLHESQLALALIANSGAIHPGKFSS